VASLPIEERLRHYFLAMGAQPNTNVNEPQPGNSFSLGQDTLHLAILKPEDLAIRNRVIETVLSLSSLRTSQLVYLAAPRLLGATMDAGIFRAHGIGLLLYDDRRIDEAVAAQPVRTITPQATPINTDSALVGELTSLKAMYGEMERHLAQLREDMRIMQQNPRGSEPAMEQIHPPPLPSREPIFAASPLVTPSVESAALPSYFNNNPWLDVLSKRGRSEN
jgi:hypothetical protein